MYVIRITINIKTFTFKFINYTGYVFFEFISMLLRYMAFPSLNGKNNMYVNLRISVRHDNPPLFAALPDLFKKFLFDVAPMGLTPIINLHYLLDAAPTGLIPIINLNFLLDVAPTGLTPIINLKFLLDVAPTGLTPIINLKFLLDAAPMRLIADTLCFYLMPPLRG